LPSKDEARAQLLATMLAPAQNFVRLLNAPGQQMVLLLNAKQRKDEGG
jgi:ribosomal protein L10